MFRRTVKIAELSVLCWFRAVTWNASGIARDRAAEGAATKLTSKAWLSAPGMAATQ